jgi:hypothetical protein
MKRSLKPVLVFLLICLTQGKQEMLQQEVKRKSKNCLVPVTLNLLSEVIQQVAVKDHLRIKRTF